MNVEKILRNVFSNWASLAITIAISFTVSPILVNRLGNVDYGIWTMVISITGYFTVLDFGVNTAIVRYISKFHSQKKLCEANQVFNTSLSLFLIIGVFALCFSFVFGYFFKDLFHIMHLPRTYLHLLFFIIGFDLVLSLVFSVYQGTLVALQEFIFINTVGIGLNVLKNIIIVFLMYNDYGLVSIAINQITFTLLRVTLQYFYIVKKYSFFKLRLKAYANKEMLGEIYKYSIYSFLIAVALKILFYTDSLVIGSMLDVSWVTFYAIPSTIVGYLEKLIWAIIAVLIPVISSQDAVGSGANNRDLYESMTKYTLALSIPVVFVLFTAGRDFISIWMGEEYGGRSIAVLQILLIGYLFLLSQLVAQGILKGISKHKFLALLLCVEAVANLFLSLLLAKKYGIAGVAVGTALPLLVVNTIFIPAYTCRQLDMSYLSYMAKSYIPSMILLAAMFIAWYGIGHGLNFRLHLNNYFQVALYSFIIMLISGVYAYCFIIDDRLRKKVTQIFRVLLRFKGI